tara:strand:+ start:1584 stop:1994 length:411 start_codon:yes stop_codon:yes gene_type:complete
MSDSDAERSLWVKVISQHLEDATSLCPNDSGDTPHRRHLARITARAWLLVPNEGFREVCELAGLDHLAVRRFARAKIEAFEERNANALRARAVEIEAAMPPLKIATDKPPERPKRQSRSSKTGADEDRGRVGNFDR